MSTTRILKIMKIISWIVFIGLCIQAGALLISSFISVFINNEAVNNLYLGLDLSQLQAFSMSHYKMFVVFVVVLAILKAYTFYWVIKLFAKIDLDYPFTIITADSISKIGYVSLSIGIISILVNGYYLWLLKQAFITMPSFIIGGKSYLFLGGIILITAFIFKRGVELQDENNLTI